MARRINRDRPGGKPLVRFFSGPAAKDCLDPQNDFPRTEWFGHVIIGAEFETNDAIDLLCSRGQHQDRNVARSRFAFQNFANFEPGHFWQHQIENDEVRFFRARFGQTGGAIRCG